MSYYESAEGETISKARAKQEVEKHDAESFEVFLQDMGEHDTYDAQAVLAWLGY